MSINMRRGKEKAGDSGDTMGSQERWRWYHGVAFYAIIQGLTFGLSGLVNISIGKRGKDLGETFFGDVAYFRRLKQVVIAPPSWAFGPAWTINNIAVIWGTLHVLNKPAGTEGRETYLALQAASWLDFVLFNTAYFSLRSPINALLLTMIMLILTIASGFVTIFKLKDTKVGLSLATLMVWLMIAATAAAFQVAWNRDDFYKVGPFAKVDPNLEKKVVS